jgi:hypothetical protein
LEKENAVGAWRELAGPTNSVKAKEIAPNSIRALFGTDGSQNAVHGSDSPISSEREIQIIFGTSVSPFPDPLPGQEPIQPKLPTPRTSVTDPSKLTAKSAGDMLNLILGNDGKGSQSNLQAKSSMGSRNNLTGSKSNLASSKANLATSKANLAGSKGNLVSGSKGNLSSRPASAKGSTANLSKSAAGSKQKLSE